MWKTAALLGCVLAGVGCTKAKVSVVCHGQGTPPAVACTLTETDGKADVKTCWDMTFKCGNGTAPKKHACEHVSGGKSVDKTYPLLDFSNAGKCDQITAGSLDVEKLSLE